MSGNLRTVHISTPKPNLTCDHLIKVTNREPVEASTCVGPVCMVWTGIEIADVGQGEEERAHLPPHTILSSPLPLPSSSPPSHLPLSQPTLIYTGALGNRISSSDAGQLPHVLKIETGISSHWLANASLMVTDIFNQDNTRDVSCKQWRTFV